MVSSSSSVGDEFARVSVGFVTVGTSHSIVSKTHPAKEREREI
jgi:hypothetical protein